jgi:dTDP-4-dehydrorhamnose reductase
MKRSPARVLLTGGNGLLGQKITEMFSQSPAYAVTVTSHQEHSVYGHDTVTYRRLDVTDRKAVLGLMEELQPEIVINCAAITNVDACETNREPAWNVNVRGVEYLLHGARLCGGKMIQISTDYVFDGRMGPYTEADRPNPISYYGRTKLAAENLLHTSGIPHAVVRTMVLYGHGRKLKPNFVSWLLAELNAGRNVRVVDDQIGNPTLAEDLAFGILKIIELQRTGTYHICGPELVSRYEFAVRIAKAFSLDKKLIERTVTAALSQPAPRPLKSGFILLKASVELGLAPAGVDSGLRILKNQIETYQPPVEIT